MKFRTILFEKCSGSIGKVTGAMGRGGNYYRNKVRPKDRKSSRQQAIRLMVNKANSIWKNTHQLNRDSWDKYGNSLKYTNNTGAEVRHTGLTAFTRLYILWEQAGFNGIYAIGRHPKGRKFRTGNTYNIEQVENQYKIRIRFPGTRSGSEFDFYDRRTRSIYLFISPAQPVTRKNYYGSYKFLTYIRAYSERPTDYEITNETGRYFLKCYEVEDSKYMTRAVYKRVDISIIP